SICVKSTAWDLMTPLYPVLPTLPVHLRSDGKHVRYVPPPPRSLPRDLRRSLPVRLIVFPSYEPSANTAMEPLSKAEALARLLAQCLAVPLNLDLSKVAALVRWISSVEAYMLRIAVLEEGVAAVARVSRSEPLR